MTSLGNPLKKVGSLLGDDRDVEGRKKNISTVALSKLNAVLLRQDKIKLKIRLKSYKSLIKSILLYNCGTWSLTKHQEENLDTYHRKQLRKILGIKYPTRLSNAKLYEKCKETCISLSWKQDGDSSVTSLEEIKTFQLIRPCNSTSIKAPQTKTLEEERVPNTLARDLGRMNFGDHTYYKHLELSYNQD